MIPVNGENQSQLTPFHRLQLYLRALLRKKLGSFGEIHSPLNCILHDNCAGPDQRFRSNRNRIPQSCVDPYETVITNVNISGDDNMRSQEAMILNHRVMTNVIAAPKCDVASDLDERLNGIVLKNEAVVANRMLG
jgi:hypothetical protein